LYFELPVLEAALRYHNAVWNTDQLPIGKHRAGPLAAIVQDHVNTQRLELVVQVLGLFANLDAAIESDRANRHQEGSHCIGPDDPARVVVLPIAADA
jgi:hypothetical protein